MGNPRVARMLEENCELLTGLEFHSRAHEEIGVGVSIPCLWPIPANWIGDICIDRGLPRAASFFRLGNP
jgi:hypothetical protein